MACLGAVRYDPGTAVTKALSSALAMTAFDTTNARITFTAPSNGKVLVKLRVASKGGTSTEAQILLGVLEGSTVRGRQTPVRSGRVAQTTHLRSHEAVFLVTGLTPSTSYSFDAAYGVETVLAAGLLGYGGPNNTTASDAYGELSFEVWETTELLDGKHYDPGTAVDKVTTGLLAMTALDTTNLRLTVTIPSSGRILVRLRGTLHGAAGNASVMLGVLDGSTVRMRQAGLISLQSTAGATDLVAIEACSVLTGLTPGSMTLDAAYGVETVVASSGLKYGGPNDTTVNNAFGGFTFEVWKA